MKTEGILLTMMNAGLPDTKKDIKTGGNEFGNLMTNLASARGEAAGLQNAKYTGSSFEAGAAESSKQEYDSRQDMSPDELPDKVTGKKVQGQQTESKTQQPVSEEVKKVISEELQNKIKEVLAEKLGLSEEDLMDLLEQMGIGLMDLLMPVNMETFTVEGINTEQIKNLLLEFHGVEDLSALLTNPELEQELTGLIKEAQETASKLQEAIQTIGKTAVDETGNEALPQSGNAEDVLPEEGVLAENLLPQTEQNPETADSGDESAAAQNTKVSVESDNTGANQNGSGTEENPAGKSSKFTGTEKTAEVKQTHVNTALNAFIERLDNAFQKALGEIHKIPVTTESVFDQVINHIRIRVLPETTSMEMSLNPAHLGRVNISVSSVSGVATATMTVQNEAAKEALQSQLITLKETFAEKGLKVESVEVTVSDFGFKKESNESNQGSSAGQSRSKGSGTGSPEGSGEGTAEAVSSRSFGTQASRTEDSVIDYTA